MNTVIMSWIALTLVLGIAAWIAIWSRRQTRARILGVLTFLAGSPVAFFALAICLGLPMPLIAGVTGPAGDFLVIGQKLVPNEAIYILVDLGKAPRHFVLPWDSGTAKKLQDAADREEGMKVKIPPMDFSWERRDPLSFHPLPQPKVLPDKPRQEEQPKRFDNI